jgi:hypothetical protein
VLREPSARQLSGKCPAHGSDTYRYEARCSGPGACVGGQLQLKRCKVSLHLASCLQSYSDNPNCRHPLTSVVSLTPTVVCSDDLPCRFTEPFAWGLQHLLNRYSCDNNAQYLLLNSGIASVSTSILRLECMCTYAIMVASVLKPPEVNHRNE